MDTFEILRSNNRKKNNRSFISSFSEDTRICIRHDTSNFY